jgi:hypothetical protein
MQTLDFYQRFWWFSFFCAFTVPLLPNTELELAEGTIPTGLTE